MAGASLHTGFGSEIGHDGSVCGPCPAPHMSAAWLSPERIAETRRIWSPAYGRVISDDEAMEILTNVRQLAQALMLSVKEN